MSAGTATLESLAKRLRSRTTPPDTAPPSTHMSAEASGTPRAAVALVLRDAPAGLELLLIKRADRDDDPWSGQVALPGGREEPSDASLEATAVRETREETGIDLEHQGEMLGPLDALRPYTRPLAVLVQPFVAALHESPPLTLSDEVAAAFWVPLATFAGPGAAKESTVRVRDTEMRVPSFRHGDYVVWGLTERIIRQLLDVVAPSAGP